MPALLGVAVAGADLLPAGLGRRPRRADRTRRGARRGRVAVHACCYAGAPVALAVYAAVTVGGGFGVEVLGVHTGLPFGAYRYAVLARRAVFGVPVLIALAWPMLAWPAALAARRLVRGVGARIVLGAWALAAWDVFLDPQMVAAGHWRWLHPAPHLPGVGRLCRSPTTLGWLVVALVMSLGGAAAAPVGRRGRLRRRRVAARVLRVDVGVASSLALARVPGPARRRAVGLRWRWARWRCRCSSRCGAPGVRRMRTAALKAVTLGTALAVRGRGARRGQRTAAAPPPAAPARPARVGVGVGADPGPRRGGSHRRVPGVAACRRRGARARRRIDATRTAARAAAHGVRVLTGRRRRPALARQTACLRATRRGGDRVTCWCSSTPTSASRRVRSHAAVALLDDARLDLVSPHPRQEVATFAGAAGPAAAAVVDPHVPAAARWPNARARPSLVAANGQFLVVRRDAYERAGGHVPDAVLDDLALLRAVKRAGGRGVVVDGTDARALPHVRRLGRAARRVRQVAVDGVRFAARSRRRGRRAAARLRRAAAGRAAWLASRAWSATPRPSPGA